MSRFDPFATKQSCYHQLSLMRGTVHIDPGYFCSNFYGSHLWGKGKVFNVQLLPVPSKTVPTAG